MERLTHKRVNGIKDGYWSTNKKQELVDRLAEYEDTGMDPEDIRKLQQAGPDDSDFNKFLDDLTEAVRTEVRHGMKSYTSKICFIAELLVVSADQPGELSFTASQIRRAFEVAKKNERSETAATVEHSGNNPI